MVSLTWAPFARVIIAKAKKLGGQGVTFRRTLPRYVSKTSNISRPVEHPERTICLPTLRPPHPSLPRHIIGASPWQHGFLLRINGRRTAHVRIPSTDYVAIGRREEIAQCAGSRKYHRSNNSWRTIYSEWIGRWATLAIQFSAKLRAPVKKCFLIHLSKNIYLILNIHFNFQTLNHDFINVLEVFASWKMQKLLIRYLLEDALHFLLFYLYVQQYS